jgi:hypothetical protein
LSAFSSDLRSFPVFFTSRSTLRIFLSMFITYSFVSGF